MSARTTLAPALASAVAMPRPMPEAAPVTMAVLPEMSSQVRAFALSGWESGMGFGLGEWAYRKIGWAREY